MVEIEKIEVYGRFRYLWLKYVKGVDLSVHCAKCLLGTYSKKIKNTMALGDGILLNEDKSPYYYLCGVTVPYVWKNNFHLAFKEEDGSYIDIDRNGIRIKIKNAKEIPITDKDIDPLDPNAKKKEYSTCRNWQFAWAIKNSI